MLLFITDDESVRSVSEPLGKRADLKRTEVYTKDLGNFVGLRVEEII